MTNPDPPGNLKERTAIFLRELTRGDSKAADELLPLLYEELQSVARGLFRQQDANHTLNPTALVHEAYLRLVDHELGWDGQSHFKAVAAKAMRQVLVDHHRRRKAAKRGVAWNKVTLSSGALLGDQEELDFLALHEALERLGKLDERQSKVVELRFFGGLNMEEIAKTLGLSKTTVEAEWRHSRAWLRRELSPADPSAG